MEIAAPSFNTMKNTKQTGKLSKPSSIALSQCRLGFGSQKGYFIK